MPKILTNNTNIPEVFARACEIDRHRTYGDISVTGLIDAPQPRYLIAMNTVEQDVSDMLWMLFGTAMHHIVERAEVGDARARQIMDAVMTLTEVAEERKGVEGKFSPKKLFAAAEYLRDLAKTLFPEAFNTADLIEKTLSVTIKTDIGSLELSGTMDKFQSDIGLLTDYKLTSTWAYIYEESKKKWYAQQNTYAWMLRESGYEVKNSQITALFKDWSKINTFKSKDYPKSMVMNIPVKLGSHKAMTKYMKERATIHLRAMQGDVDPCSDKERWASDDVFKVRKPGANRALNKGVFTNETSAVKFMEDNSLKYPKLEIEHKPGENKRCESFCVCKDVCPQYKAIKESKSYDKSK